MLRLIRFRTSAYALLALLGAAIVFQLTVLAGVIPTEMVWGGRLQNEEERTVGAWVSIAFLVVFAVLLLVRLGAVGRTRPALGKWGMWAVCVFFALNIVGNLFALDLRETLIFTPVTLACAVLAARVAMGE